MKLVESRGPKRGLQTRQGYSSGKVQPPPLGAPDEGYPALEDALGSSVLQP